MNCDKSPQVHAYYDEILSASERIALDAHLVDCGDCRDLLADLRGLSNLIAAAPLAVMPPDAMARLSESYRAARDRGLLRITTWLTAAAAGILVGALLFWPDRHGGAGPTYAQEPATFAAWETVAVMPPLEADENVPELVALAQWMANDLSPHDVSAGDFSVGERQ